MSPRAAGASGPLIFSIPEAVGCRLSMHATKHYPRECCGFLIGRRQDEIILAAQVLTIENVARRLDRFAMAPESVLAADRFARAGGMEVLALYHSHPGGEAFPSETDREEAIPGMLHLILAARASGTIDARVWMLAADGRFDPVALAGGIS